MAPTGRSRTVKTLAALVAAMAVGACVLILMEIPPAGLTAPTPLRAGSADGPDIEPAAIHQTDVPIQRIKWRNIIVHDAAGLRQARPGRDQADQAGGCHFLIGAADPLGEGVIRPTPLWRRQLDGNHIVVPGYSYNENSIGIRLLCDTRRAAPTSKQMAALISLVQALQVTCQISSDHVYLHSELGAPGCPGRFFPAKFFRSRLIATAR